MKFIITGKCSCTIQVSAELLMTGWLCRSVPYMESAPLYNDRKTSGSEVHYSQEALYQMLFTLWQLMEDSRYNKISIEK